jgi:hypothetical protein
LYFTNIFVKQDFWVGKQTLLNTLNPKPAYPIDASILLVGDDDRGMSPPLCFGDASQ